jgi:phospholipid/cholesterol/gamma-HCH transport system substrate-binding protein
LKIKKEILVGLLVLLTGGMLYWGVNYLKGMNIFSEEGIYYAVYPNVDGLMITNPVLINGLKVGQIKDVYFEENRPSDVIVEIMITQDIRIPANSLAKIISSDIMGSKALSIIPGNATFYAKTGDTLEAKVEESITDAINRELQPIKRKAENVMGSIDTLLTVLQGVMGGKNGRNFSESLQRVLNTMRYLEESSLSFNDMMIREKPRFIKIVDNLESITSNLNNNKEYISNIIQNFSSISDTLAKVHFQETLAHTDKSIRDFDAILKQINSGEGSLGLLLKNDSLYNALNKSSIDLDILLKDIKENPKKYLNFSVF